MTSPSASTAYFFRLDDFNRPMFRRQDPDNPRKWHWYCLVETVPSDDPDGLVLDRLISQANQGKLQLYHRRGPYGEPEYPVSGITLARSETGQQESSHG